MTTPVAAGSSRSSRLEDIVPAAAWLRAYERSWVRGDVVGGLAAGAVVVPQAMAYASIARLPAEIGLYTCMVPLLVYAALGGSRTLSASTTSTVATLTGSTLLAASTAAAAEDPERALATLTVLVGLVLVVARLLRLGSLVDSISGATVTGIKVGVGLTVAAGQLPALLGVEGDVDAESFFARIGGLVDGLGDASATTIALSAGTVAVLLALAQWVPSAPGPLVAVAGGIALVALGGIDEHGVVVIAPVASGLPTPVLPGIEGFSALLPGALAIAVMCFMETATAARAARRPTEPPIDNDQELLANGLSCIGGGLFRAMPAAGGFSQTAVNEGAGARTQVSGLISALLAVGCALFLGGVLSDLPQATLGAVVLVAVMSLMQPAELLRYWRHSRLELWVALVTAAAGVFFSLLVAVLVGVVLTLYLVLHELGHVGVSELQQTADATDVRVVGPDTRPDDGLLVVRVDGPLYTANVGRVNRRVLAVLDSVLADRPVDVLVLDLTSAGPLPYTVLDQARDLDRELRSRGVELWASGLPQSARDRVDTIALWHELEDHGRVHPTAIAAVRAHRAD